MPAPSGALTTLRPDLGGSLEEFDIDANLNRFIATRVFPIFEVPEAGGSFGKLTNAQLMKQADVTRNARSGYNRVEFDFGEDTYSTKEYGIEVPMDENQAKMYRHYFDFEVACARLARYIVMQAVELRMSALVFNATTFASYFNNVVNEWNDYSNATPVTDVHRAKLRFRQRNGVWPNAMIINDINREHLTKCDEVLEEIRSAGAGDRSLAVDITDAKLAEVFKLDEIIVGGGTVNNANEGLTEDFQPIWSNEYCALTRVARRNDLFEPAVGRTLHWDADGSLPGGMVEQYYSNEVRGTVCRNRHQVQEKLMMLKFVELLGNVNDPGIT